MEQSAPNNFTPSVPSADSAYKILKGEEGAVFNFTRDIFFRGVLIRLGMEAAALFGAKLPRNAFALSLFGSLAIEAAVLVHIAATMPKKK